MTIELAVLPENEEWYQSLIDDCKSIITEAVFTSRWALVEGNWLLGQRVVTENNLDRKEIYGKNILQGLGKSIGISDSALYYAIQLYTKYPQIDTIPEGKNITMNKLITKYLPNEGKESTKDYQSIDEIYQFLWGPDVVINRYGRTVKIKLRTQRVISGYEWVLHYIEDKLDLAPKGNPQFYFTGIAYEDSIYPWVIINWINIELERLKNPQAEFTIKQILEEFIIAKSK